MSANPRCLVIGDINIDIAIKTSNIPISSSSTQDGSIDFRLGGSGCITALMLGKLGVITALAANLGNEALADFVDSFLASSGLDFSLVSRNPGQQTGFFLMLETSGIKPSLISNRGANALPIERESLMERLGDFDHLHISGYSLKGTEQFKLGREAVIAMKKVSGTVSLDPGMCTSRDAAGNILDLLKWVDYFLPNQAELSALIDASSEDEKLKVLLKQGCRAVVLKMGNKGGQYMDGKECV